MILRQKAQLNLLFAATLATMVGCGKQQDTDTASDIKIVGGQEVQNSQQDERRWSTVALTTDHIFDGATASVLSQNHSFCSGTLVAPRVVMTAAHCIEEFDANTHQRTGAHIRNLKDTDFLVHFDNHVTPEGTYIRAVRAMGHQNWDPNQTLSAQPTAAANDIGIIILEKDAPSFARPAAMATSITAGEPAFLAGYGVTKSRDNNDTGILRQVEVAVKKLDSTGKRIQVGKFMKGACAGDSGGPLYVKRGNSYEVAGATSTGAEIAGRCIGLMNNYTDTTNYISWVQEQSHALLKDAK